MPEPTSQQVAPPFGGAAQVDWHSWSEVQCDVHTPPLLDPPLLPPLPLVDPLLPPELDPELVLELPELVLELPELVLELPLDVEPVLPPDVLPVVDPELLMPVRSGLASYDEPPSSPKSVASPAPHPARTAVDPKAMSEQSNATLMGTPFLCEVSPATHCRHALSLPGWWAVMGGSPLKRE
jgi:hypothetical protein